MNAELADRIRRLFAARGRWEDHFDGCRTCGTPRGLCATGRRLHTEYADLNVSVSKGR